MFLRAFAPAWCEPFANRLPGFAGIVLAACGVALRGVNWEVFLHVRVMGIAALAALLLAALGGVGRRLHPGVHARHAAPPPLEALAGWPEGERRRGRVVSRFDRNAPDLAGMPVCAGPAFSITAEAVLTR